MWLDKSWWLFSLLMTSWELSPKWSCTDRELQDLILSPLSVGVSSPDTLQSWHLSPKVGHLTVCGIINILKSSHPNNKPCLSCLTVFNWRQNYPFHFFCGRNQSEATTDTVKFLICLIQFKSLSLYRTSNQGVILNFHFRRTEQTRSFLSVGPDMLAGYVLVPYWRCWRQPTDWRQLQRLEQRERWDWSSQWRPERLTVNIQTQQWVYFTS